MRCCLMKSHLFPLQNPKAASHPLDSQPLLLDAPTPQSCAQHLRAFPSFDSSHRSVLCRRIRLFSEVAASIGLYAASILYAWVSSDQQNLIRHHSTTTPRAMQSHRTAITTFTDFATSHERVPLIRNNQRRRRHPPTRRPFQTHPQGR